MTDKVTVNASGDFYCSKCQEDESTSGFFLIDSRETVWDISDGNDHYLHLAVGSLEEIVFALESRDGGEKSRFTLQLAYEKGQKRYTLTLHLTIAKEFDAVYKIRPHICYV